MAFSIRSDIEELARKGLVLFNDKAITTLCSTEPETLEAIKPALAAYRGDVEDSVNLAYHLKPKEALVKLQTEGFLEKITDVVIIVHGFCSHIGAGWMHEIRKALLNVTDRLVLIVGWGEGADVGIIPYAQAAVNIQTVSTWLAEILNGIRTKFKSVYIWGVGHSLGAHLLGQTGRKCGHIDRITGLDPAGPLFEQRWDKMEGMRKTDAKMVDCIHSDGFNPTFDKVSPIDHFGTLTACGTIDFYPNFGLSPQPGCKQIAPNKLARSHQRAHEYFFKSVNDHATFRTDQELIKRPEPGKPCNISDIKRKRKSAQMGYNANKAKVTEGLFYVDVNDWNREQEEDSINDMETSESFFERAIKGMKDMSTRAVDLVKDLKAKKKFKTLYQENL